MSALRSGTTGKIVSLNGLPHGRSPGQRLLGECRDLLVDRLTVWLREIATPISEELFVLADSTRDRLLQTHYLDLRADIESDWQAFAETFRRTLTQAAEHKQNTQHTPHASPLEPPDFAGLTLMDDADLSEHIVLREFAAQLSESCDEELYTLNRRVAVLLDRDEPCDNDNPLAPAIVCEALSEAGATIGDNAERRLILLRRIERHLHTGLPPAYRQINAMLIERGILPDLKRTYRRSLPGVSNAAAINTPLAQPTASAGLPATAMPSTQLDANGDEILAALQRLVQARGLPGATHRLSPFTTNQASPIDASTTAPVAPAYNIDQLLRDALVSVPPPPSPTTTGPGIPPLDSQLQAIVNQVRVVRDSPGARQLGGLEALTLDIVAILFDFIFDDAQVPLAIKALLSRLQIPVLKVAMRDPDFFADRQHPTRRFLAGIAGVSIRWGDQIDENDPFYTQLAGLVDHIQSHFEDDIDVFGAALSDLEAFVETHEPDEDDTALAAANLVLQREQESTAWERAQRAVGDFIAVRNLPPALADFLQEHWRTVLKNAAQAANNDSAADHSGAQAWSKAQSLMGDLAWSVEPKRNPDDRLRLVSLLPDLLSGLNKGLDGIGMAAEERTAFFDALVKLHAAALKGENASPAQTPEPAPTSSTALEWSGHAPTEGELLVTRSIDNGIEVEDVMLVGGSAIWRADEREIMRQVGDLKRGDWVEFRDDDGHSNRERLNWISPQRGILLFSNHRAAKAISIVPEALVRQIRDGKAAIVQPEAIFERALSGALDTLANTSPSAPC